MPDARICGLFFIVLSLSACSDQTPADNSGKLSKSGLEATRCWFDNNYDLPEHQCFYFHVKESPEQADSATVSMPVVRFKSTQTPGANPVIHLGGGGPGASLFLDSAASVFILVHEMQQISLAQGRDLFLIDPRGAGMARPSLTCPEFANTVPARWQHNLTLEESYRQGHQTISECIERLRIDGRDFSRYNSTSIAMDVEQLRRALNIDQWILFGVSYATVYAQTIARLYPSSVEAMVLDSATFLDIDPHDTYLNQLMAPYRFLFNYCEHAPACDQPLENTEQRFWSIKEQLDNHPVTLVVPHPVTGKDLRIQLNGWRFLDTALWAAYNEDIFITLPNIITEMEQGKTDAITPYVEQLLGFLVDTSFGDISSESHYCIESKPLIDASRINALISTIANPHIQQIATLSLEFLDHCEELGLSNQSAAALRTVATDIPTLFIHGALDSTTLLSDVLAKRDNFSNSSLITAPESHNVHDNACVNERAARYIRSEDKQVFTLICEADNNP